MSEDNIYRQERKRISPSEISGGSNSPSLDDVLSFHRQAGTNVPETERKEVSNVNPKPVEGVAVTGKIPPAMHQLMQQRIAEMENGVDEMPMKDFSQPRSTEVIQRNTMPVMQTNMSPMNDVGLNALLGTLHTQNYEKIVLPSLGRFYKDSDTPQSGELHIRPMTGQEETILSTARFMRSGKGIDMIFRNCIQERNINPEKLMSVDRTYMLIFLRAISYGNIYEVSLKCPECNHQFDYDINLDLNVDYCPDNFSELDLVKRLPKSQFDFSYRFMTSNDETEISQYRERKTKHSNSVDDSFLYKAATLISEISNGSAKVVDKQSILALLEKLPVGDVNYIRNVLDEPPFGVDTTVSVPCPSCHAEFEVELPFETSFFFPKEKTEIELR